MLFVLALAIDVSGEEKTDLVPRGEKTNLPECFFEEMNRLEQEVAYLRLALKKARKHLHMAHVELGAKADEIFGLEAELCDLSSELAAARSKRVIPTAVAEPSLPLNKRHVEMVNPNVPDRSYIKQVAFAGLSPAKGGPIQGNSFPVSTPDSFDTFGPAAPKTKAEGEDPRIAPILFTKKTTVNLFEQDRIEKECKMILAEHPGAKFDIVGHADDFSFPSTNLVVSLNRAKFVARNLSQRGIPESALTVEGKGDREPSSSGNRRVEVKILLP